MVDWDGLENRCAARYRGFESHPLRHGPLPQGRVDPDFQKHDQYQGWAAMRAGGVAGGRPQVAFAGIEFPLPLLSARFGNQGEFELFPWDTGRGDPQGSIGVERLSDLAGTCQLRSRSRSWAASS